MRLEQRPAEFTAYVPKKNTASLAHPQARTARRDVPELARRRAT
jgi:hypothetical protein